MEIEKRKEDSLLKSLFSKVAFPQTMASIQRKYHELKIELVALVDDTKLKDALMNNFLSGFEPIFDPEAKKEFLPCEYYRIGKSYR